MQYSGRMTALTERRNPAQGKCTPLRFTWKDNAINVGKLMRYELVKELQSAGPDVEVECTGDPTELTELKIKDEVWGPVGECSVLQISRQGRTEACAPDWRTYMPSSSCCL